MSITYTCKGEKKETNDILLARECINMIYVYILNDFGVKNDPNM